MFLGAHAEVENEQILLCFKYDVIIHVVSSPSVKSVYAFYLVYIADLLLRNKIV